MYGEPVNPRQPVIFDSREFRNALGCFVTGVCIMTTCRSDGRREGLTVNSFSSVSLNPPMVLWSLARKATSLPAFRDAEFFAINVLAADQQKISDHFARPSPDKFAEVGDLFVDGIGGLPLIEGASARFQCRNQFQNYGGDHVILIGTVEKFEHWPREPLLFHCGRYARLEGK